MTLRPPARIDAGPVVLRRYTVGDVAPLQRAINESLTHLAPWMPWAQEAATEASAGAFVSLSIANFDAGTDFAYCMVEDGAPGGDEVIVGGCGLHRRGGPGGLEIGYWVSVARVRRGIATAAAGALTQAAFMLGLEWVEIRCDEANVASAGVPARLGFTLVGLVRRPPAAPAETGVHMVWRREAAVSRGSD